MLYISKYTYDIILRTFANSVGKYECKWFKVIDAFGFHSVSTLEARYIYIYIYRRDSNRHSDNSQREFIELLTC